MSKSLKKLIDINRLREFKNKLVGTGSAYVQTGEVDQTVGGTKTFPKPIVGSVTGSSGSCTGNAATATTAGAVSTSIAEGSAKDVVYAYMASNDAFRIRCGGGGDDGYVEIATSDNGNEPIYVRQYDLNGGELGEFKRIVRTLTLLDGSGNTSFPGTVTATAFYGNITGNVTGNCSGSSGSCTGNAATATKLAAKRTIALSGAATGTATGFDGSGNITIPVTALASSAIRAQWYAAFPDGAEAHNSMWGGRDITAAFDAGTVSANIANGTFKDIFPGDYITKQVTISDTTYNVNWVVADCDYWINKGDTAMTAHHVVIVPQAPIFSANMNDTNTTEGGYAGSRMYTETIPACATGIVAAFGSDHILTFRDSITRAVNTSSISSGAPFWTGASSDWGWYDAQCNLMSERMVYGMPAFSSSAWDAGVATRQMSIFRLSEKAINPNRQWWWLRDVVSSPNFAFVSGDGSAATYGASGVLGVRPFALLR